MIVTGTTGYCRCCGTLLFSGTERVRLGGYLFCAPEGSACHALGVRSAGWGLTEADAAALLAADVSAQQEQQARAA